MAAVIEARSLSVSIGTRRIVSKVEFLASAGAVTIIVGPNGSGKTTLMKAVSGELPYAGTVALNGHEIAHLKPWLLAAKRAVLAQATTLAFPFTVREIVRLGLSAGRPSVSLAGMEQLPELALERVDLSSYAGRFYQELSGGEQQRVQLARVLCQVWEPVLDGAPRYLLLDEPVSSLDIKHQLIIMEIARDFARRGGGVVAVLHDLNLASVFADKMVVMKAGQIAASGAPSDVFDDRILSSVFDCALRVNGVPRNAAPFVLPHTGSTVP